MDGLSAVLIILVIIGILNGIALFVTLIRANVCMGLYEEKEYEAKKRRIIQKEILAYNNAYNNYNVESDEDIEILQ